MTLLAAVSTDLMQAQADIRASANFADSNIIYHNSASNWAYSTSGGKFGEGVWYPESSRECYVKLKEAQSAGGSPVIRFGLWMRSDRSTRYIANGSPANNLFLSLGPRANTTHQFKLYLSANYGCLYPYSGSSGGTREYSKIHSVPEQSWVWVEGKWTYGSFPSGQSLDLWVNGVQVYSQSSAGWQNPSYGDVDCIIIEGSGGVIEVDDIMVWVDDGSGMEGYQGPMRIKDLAPNSDGADENWLLSGTGTDSYTMVDDTIPGSPNDSDYLYGDDTTPGSNDVLLGVEDFAESIDTVNGGIQSVGVWYRHQEDDSIASTIRCFIDSNGTEADGDTINPADQVWDWAHDYFDVNPDDSAAWEDTDIDALQVGLKYVG